MSGLWTAADAAAATGGALRGGDWTATGLSIDTRTIQPGDLFIALSDVRDGHDFAGDALAKGAVAALVSRVPAGLEDAPLLVVPEVQAALEALGRAGRARMGGKVIAVTGSVGKTTTKDMLRAALAPQGRTHASVASYNNHWGVPLTLARMPADTDFGIIEIGMNAPGEIAPLSAMAAPDVAIVTNVGAAHLEAFGEVAGIAREKGSIFDGLRPGGIAIAHADGDTAPILFDAARGAEARLIRFGETAGVEAHADLIETGDAATILRGQLGDQPVLLKLPVPGRHYAMNALAVLAAVEAVGADLARACMALSAWQPVTGRGTRETIILNLTDGQGVELIDDAFNANPDSVAAGLEVLAAAEPEGKGRRIAVLGDMLELGAAAASLHAGLADLPSMARVDLVFTAGDLMASLHDSLPEDRKGLHCDSADALAQALPAELRAGDILLVKGSKSSHMSRVVDALRKLGQAVADRG